MLLLGSRFIAAPGPLTISSGQMSPQVQPRSLGFTYTHNLSLSPLLVVSPNLPTSLLPLQPLSSEFVVRLSHSQALCLELFPTPLFLDWRPFLDIGHTRVTTRNSISPCPPRPSVTSLPHLWLVPREPQSLRCRISLYPQPKSDG